MLNAQQTHDLAALKGATGMMRDQLYVRQQKAAHADALSLMQSYSAAGTAQHLKAAAAEIVPVVQMHKDMSDKM
jgi:putative membrane protein